MSSVNNIISTPNDSTPNDSIQITINKLDLNCPVCLDILIDPVTLSCGHSFCIQCLKSSCVNEYNKKLIKNCMICKKELDIHLDKHAVNTFMVSLLKSYPGYVEEIKARNAARHYENLKNKFKSSKLQKYMSQLIIKIILDNGYIHIDNFIQCILCNNTDVKLEDPVIIFIYGIKFLLKTMYDKNDILIFKDMLFPCNGITVDNYIRNNIETLSGIEVYYLNDYSINKKLHACKLKYELENFDLIHSSNFNSFVKKYSSIFQNKYSISNFKLPAVALTDVRLLNPIPERLIPVFDYDAFNDTKSNDSRANDIRVSDFKEISIAELNEQINNESYEDESYEDESYDHERNYDNEGGEEINNDIDYEILYAADRNLSD